MWHIRNGSDHFSERAVAELVDKQRKNQGDRHTPAQAGDIEPNGVPNQPPKKPVIKEMQEKNKEHYLMNKLEFVKNPVIAEFLGYSLDSNLTETDLETSIINNLQKFLMELRKRLCICCKTTTHTYGKRRLLY